MGLLTDRQRAVLTLGSGDRPAVAIGVDVTSGGLLAIGALVSSILLSTAVVVGVAVREARRGCQPVTGRRTVPLSPRSSGL